ncbi:GntR family transcriptional regulator [Allokutzneria sp. A3M-2-11 16]|uniref:GntR family transcriptional regulator n=1 Tax=Allokutzneria sp. A3M-2-11 16 TaxID=2962043 RepID=UPI0020B7B072|nr:GntR family transcriptional regulator [Allokutzneria sp. A3M-2-11 16]MCP3797714.1 GntR family transcriptional regulator [Allokutzneria sp. A3M-2-11 16]
MRSGRDRAYEFLRNTVLSDPAQQGSFISEQDIADRIGVSRTPIREALLMLAAEDLVRLVPKKGAYIAPVSGREIAELMELRGVIERHAAERAIGSPVVAAMRKTLARQGLLMSEGDEGEFIELDHEFHSALVAATGNELMARMYEGLRARQIRCGVTALVRAPGRQKAVLDEHEAIVSALEAGDVEAAAAAITHHLETTRDILLTS